MERRQFLTAALAAMGAVLATETSTAQENRQTNPLARRRAAKRGANLPIVINQYTCATLYGRDNVDFWTRLDEIKDAGMDGVEVMINTGAEAGTIGKQLADHGLAMRSIYATANLHDENTAKEEIARLQEIGEKVKPLGTEIIVFNPAAKEGKSDAELIRQSKNMDIIGAAWRKMGLSLAFHFHTTELEFGGREFHHVMCGTNPRNVSLCFEEHWSYRASGNSEVAVFDHLKLYGDRSVEVHLRQSANDIWTETFGDGDIDNVRLAAGFKKLPKMPLIVLEQAPENGTPKTMSPAEVIRQSAEYIRKVFG